MTDFTTCTNVEHLLARFQCYDNVLVTEATVENENVTPAPNSVASSTTMPAQQDIKALSLVQIDKLYPLLSVAMQNIALIMSRGMLADNSFERKKIV